MTRRLTLLLLLGSLLALGGCSPDPDAGTTERPGAQPSAARGERPDPLQGARLVAQGRLTVCSDIPYAPFEFIEKGNAEGLTGFDVELVRALAERLGLTADFRATPFDAIIPALAAGNCDLVASATTITEERRRKVAFSEPYFDADQSLLLRAEDRDRYTSLEDLKGRSIGVQSGTTGERYAKTHAPEGTVVKAFPGAEDLFSALVSGDIDAVLQDFPVNQYRALNAGGQFQVSETFKTGEQYGFAVAKDNGGLVAALDRALAEVRGSGRYQAIYRRWFGEP
ncbi:MAG: basic amino acid ABC transporter substrate-binding protein [Bdellovibrio bacteriovorus]